MGYYVISKIELEGTDSLKSTDVGYTDDINVVNEVNEAYDASFGLFLGENRTKLELGIVSVSTFFASTPSVNEARTEVDDVDGLGLSKVLSINEL